ncbi:MAG: exonuclease domain-containing protein [Saprospiraceae bacterium]|nr:exonuclease domain-containing protein [Saprospiraceae bacterium]
MNFIVFDLEATCWEGSPTSLQQEIIEIGAVRLDEYGEIDGVFQSFVRPMINQVLSPFCIQLTGISQIDVNRSGRFPEVARAFQDWIEVYDEDYLLCSWGNFDKKQLVADCRLHHLDDEWLDPHINLKQQYQEFKKLRQPRGLKASVIAEGLEFSGRHHRAIDDAENLAQIFIKYRDLWRY